MPGREAVPEERVAILRALAACIAREVPVRMRDETAGAARTMRLSVEVDRDGFWRALGALRACGAVNTARLFERRRGPGEIPEIARDSAAEFGWTLQACAQAGHEVRIEQPEPQPSGVSRDEHVLTFRVHVRAEPYYALRPHQF